MLTILCRVDPSFPHVLWNRLALSHFSLVSDTSMIRNFATVCLAVCAVCSSLVVSPARCQQAAAAPSPVQLNFGAHLSPGTAASLQIQAESEYLRAYGQMQIDLAEARIRHAEARKLEGQNSVQAVLDRIRKRDLLDADRAKRIGKNLATRRSNYNKTLERLMHHPELASGEINSGSALNFLKNRLSSSVITYHASSKSSSNTDEVALQLKVTTEMVHGLQVRQSLGRGEALIFRLDDGRSIQVDWWPPALRTPALQSARTRFERARNDVFDAKPDKFDAQINDLLLAHANLEDEFLSQQTHATRIKSQQSMHDYLDGRAVLKSLSSEIRRLQRVGPGQTTTRNLAFQGHDLTELVTHMVRNGLDFAPAKPGDEPAYKQVFEMLRGLYAAAEADADNPEAPTSAVIAPPPSRFPLKEPAK